MSSKPIVSLDGVEKTYYLYKRPLDLLLRKVFTNKARNLELVHALKKITFDVNSGETLGIVGHNGSGKSTLLQIIAGTLSPSAGTCKTRGRISALLELGAGFNPEFTGKENAQISASIMGLTSTEFENKLPEIVEFSELSEFINRPVKTYSSGMYVRLAFSVAISIDPDIFIIDEALAVGDVRFQRKCFRKIESLKQQGVAILFVTHSPQTVVNICDRAILLEHGKIVEIGDPKVITNHYMQRMLTESSKPNNSQCGSHDSNNPDNDLCKTRQGYNQAEYRYGDGAARIIDFRFEDGGEQLPSFESQGTIKLDMLVKYHESIEGIIYAITVKTIGGTELYSTNSEFQEKTIEDRRTDQIVKVGFKISAHLVKGDYFISLGVVQNKKGEDIRVLDRRYDLIHFSIKGDDRAIGLVNLDVTINENNSSIDTLAIS